MNSHDHSQMVDIATEIMQFVKQNFAVALNSVKVTKSKTKCNNLVLFKGHFESTYFLASFLNVLALNMTVILVGAKCNSEHFDPFTATVSKN